MLLLKYLVTVLVVLSALYIFFSSSETQSTGEKDVLVKEKPFEEDVANKEEFFSPEKEHKPTALQKTEKNLEKTASEPEVQEVQTAPDETPKKRKLLGGADIEWIEPDPTSKAGKFGKPPM